MAVSNNSSDKVAKPARRIDRRAQRTRMALADALIALSPKEGFDKLEIGQLTAQAGVGRSTFYKHYSDKDDFLITSFAGMVAGFDREAQKRPDYRALLPAREVFAHVYQAKAFALSLMESGQYERTQVAREAKVRTIATANLKRLHPAMTASRREEIAVIAAASFTSLMRWWMEGGLRQPPDYVAGVYEAAVERVVSGEG